MKNGMKSFIKINYQNQEKNYIKEEKISIIIKKNNTAEINVRIQVYPEINIPVITEKLQGGLIDYVRTHSGVMISDAKIIVSSVNDAIQVTNNNGGYR